MFKKPYYFWLIAFSFNVYSIEVPPAPSGDAAAYIVIDYHSQQILAQKEARRRIEPASLTKMMSVYVIDHELKTGRYHLSDEVEISKKAWKNEGSRMFVEAGKKITVAELLKGIIIQSGNDATVALAEYVAGSETAFANLMNQYAKKLGMTQTHFVNSTGLQDPNHYTTAYDLSLLAQALIRDFPETYKIYSEKWFTFNGIKQPNRNLLLWREPFVDGIKTGHTNNAGYCLAASGQKDGMRLISIVLGASSEHERSEQSLQLLRYGFRFFETHALYSPQKSLSDARVWYGNQPNVKLGVNKPVYITIPQGQYQNLATLMQVDPLLKAPLQKGQVYGKLVLKLGDKVINEIPLVALEDLARGSTWSRFSDYVSLNAQQLFNFGKNKIANT